ncbi:dynein regulatory complex subunit 3-like [Coccinella septempunctata]|uniref:dynein regulatory complex subunit 3-like n=1 Tax=Coccinella septempunctata TaxID=41139 RepID=UPI001D06027F|nr:dynein regulatory complex subunit 3-like [Coccinella septempunctata]
MSSSSSDAEDAEIKDWGKFLKNRVCQEELPGIINDKLLEDLLRKQMEGNEIGKLLLQDGIHYEKITEMRIEFCNILRIDHLWMMKNLKILKMDNNFIEKIENLEDLTQLMELDLSFNKITKIENLNTLIKLKKLSLFDNRISAIENMDDLKNLTILSIGRNSIMDWKNIVYLRRLPALRSLNMADNPCCSLKDFKYFIATFLPDLQYYEYRSITAIERKIGDEIFHDDYLMMLENEKTELGHKYKLDKEEYDAKMNAESFVEYLNTRRLFDSFFENDPEGSALLLIGGEVTNLYVTYEENIVGLCKDIFKIGQVQHEIRQSDYTDFRDSVETIHKQNQSESIEHMEYFLKEKLSICEQLRKIRWLFNMGESSKKLEKKMRRLQKKFEELSTATWKSVMKLESTLCEQIMELNETYEHVLLDLINNFIEQAQGIFVTMRDVVGEFSDNLQEIAQTYYATVVFEEEEAEKDRIEAEKKKQEEMKRDEESGKKKIMMSANEINVLSDGVPEKKEEETPRERVPPGLRPYVKDRETLMNALAGSRDVHLLMVDNREDLLVSRAREWEEAAIKSLYENEIQRNRDKILEITYFIEVHTQEFKQQWSELDDLHISIPPDNISLLGQNPSEISGGPGIDTLEDNEEN